MEMIKQMKGKQFDKLPKSKVPHDTETFYVSTKFDGNYVQIHINADETVDFYTSGNKRFYLSEVADWFKFVFADLPKPLVLEAEYIYNCIGRLGDRVLSARLTTYRTLFSSFTDIKGTERDIFKVFNIVDDRYFEERLNDLRSCEDLYGVHIVEHELMTYAEAHCHAHEMSIQGWEGVMCQAPYNPYQPGKRVNSTIKIKYRPEIEAVVVDEDEGEGRLEGSIGSLKCVYEGVTFNVGSGLDDYMRAQWGSFIGTTVEIECEKLSADGVPLQPVFKRIKER